jgi:hypothetical protein
MSWASPWAFVVFSVFCGFTLCVSMHFVMFPLGKWLWQFIRP